MSALTIALAVTFAFFLFAPTRGYLWRYCRNLWVALDQLLNALLLGDPDETVSSRCAKRLRGDCKLCRYLCGLLNRIDPGHCERVVEHDRGYDAVRKRDRL